ncbi:hypothetical protein [Terasakiella pusilla]|uniref:hypothetical protein n=1 Tax=Terasakiella pusilla TaxID=64973 RepID=UPI003AA8C001
MSVSIALGLEGTEVAYLPFGSCSVCFVIFSCIRFAEVGISVFSTSFIQSAKEDIRKPDETPCPTIQELLTLYS